MSEYYLIINAFAVKTAKMTTDKDVYCMLNATFSGEVLKKSNDLKLKFRKYPSIHTNYIISHSTILQYNHNI